MPCAGWLFDYIIPWVSGVLRGDGFGWFLEPLVEAKCSTKGSEVSSYRDCKYAPQSEHSVEKNSRGYGHAPGPFRWSRPL